MHTLCDQLLQCISILATITHYINVCKISSYVILPSTLQLDAYYNDVFKNRCITRTFSQLDRYLY